MKRSNSLCFLVSMAVSRTARHESTAANDLTRELRRSVNRSRTCAYMFALRSARGTKLAKRFDARDLQTDLKREAMLTAPDHISGSRTSPISVWRRSSSRPKQNSNDTPWFGHAGSVEKVNAVVSQRIPDVGGVGRTQCDDRGSSQ